GQREGQGHRPAPFPLDGRHLTVRSLPRCRPVDEGPRQGDRGTETTGDGAELRAGAGGPIRTEEDAPPEAPHRHRPARETAVVDTTAAEGPPAVNRDRASTRRR